MLTSNYTLTSVNVNVKGYQGLLKKKVNTKTTKSELYTRV